MYNNIGDCMKVRIGVSNRHVHLTKDDFNILFGDIELIKDKDLYQPNQFASIYKVSIKTEKNELKNVRVLGPFRDYTQVEISKTDAYTLGINPPIRTSGDLKGAEIVTIVGPNGTVCKECCIIANRHIHITKEDKEKYNLSDKVCVEVGNQKKSILYDVYLKISNNSNMEMHIDTDDANGNFVKTGDEGEIK